MTISSTTRKAGPFAGNGVTTVFPFTFKVFTNTDVTVAISDANGNISYLTLNSDYSITLNADQNASPGGSITYPIGVNTPILPAGSSLAAVGNLPQLQPTDITNNGGFYPSVIEDALDRAVILIQQLQELLGRQLTLGVTDVNGSGAYRANGNRISNLGYPISDTDAATYGSARDIAEAIAAGIPGGVGTFFQNGAGAQSRTFQDKMRESVTPQDYMTDAQRMNVYLRLGTVDVSGAIQAAATAAGAGTVDLPPGNYGMTAGVTAVGTFFRGAARYSTTFTPVGNFDVFTFNGAGLGAGMCGVHFEAGGMTGGNLIATTNSHRMTFDDISANSPYNGFSINYANSASIKNAWFNAVRGAWGIKWWGTTQKSDVLDLDNVVLSGTGTTSAATGILLDGFVNTLDMRHVAATNFNRGLWTVNNSGSSSNFPALITSYDFQCDFPNQEAIRLEGGVRQCHFTDTYVHGSRAAQNIYIDATATLITFKGGKSDGGFLEGVYVNGTYCFVGAGFQVSSNGQQASNTLGGIRIGANSVGAKIVGAHSGSWTGVSTSSQNYGVVIDAGAQGYVVTGNTLRTNLTGDVLDNANDATSVVFGNSGMASSWKTPVPIQSVVGDLVMRAQGAGSVRLGNDAGYTGFAAQPIGVTVNYAKAFGNIAGSAPTLQAIGSDANVSLKLSATGTGSIVAGTNVLPSADNAFTCGGSGSRWSAIWSATGTIQTSDGTQKTDITALPAAAGLPFISALKPSFYKFAVGGNTVTKTWLNADGTAIEAGAEIPDDAVPGPDVVTPRAGVRQHGGFIAADVKAAMDAAGLDWGLYCMADADDPNSEKGLRPDELLPSLVLALQQLTARVVELEGKNGESTAA